MNSFYYTTPDKISVIIQNPFGTEKIIIISSENEDGFIDGFDFQPNVSFKELIEIIRKKNRTENEQKVLDELHEIAKSL